MKAEKTIYNDKYYIGKLRGRVTEDQLLKHATELGEKRSITPDTHKSRTLVENAEELEKFASIKDLNVIPKKISSSLEEESVMLQKEPDNLFYVDEYQYKDSKTSHVIRFGIDKYNEELKKELSIHNDKLKENLRKALEGKFETKSDISNISGVTKYKPFCEKYIELTNCEKTVIENAISYMFHTDKKTCMIDILPRELNDKTTGVGTINVKALDTHTVTLYNTGEKVLVIDPNNPMFSSHLNKYKGIETLCDTKPQYKVYSRPEESKTGYGPKLYRDCVDIAVKIAFVLNNSGNTYKDLNELMSSQAIKLVTNSSIIDEMIFTNHDLIRQKQASNIEKIIDCYQKMTKISTIETLKREKAFDDFTIKTNEVKTNYENIIGKIDEEHLISVAGMIDDYNPEL